MKKGEPIPFVGWIDDQDEVEAMLREQIHAQQNRINVLEKELTEAGGMIGVLREYTSDLENGLDSSIKLNKAQALRKTQEDDFDMDGRC